MTEKAEYKIMPGCEPLFIEGDKTGILLLHGFTGSPYEVKELGEQLGKKGYTVSIPLLKGHGTTPADLLNCRWYDWFEDSKKALFKLRKTCNTVIAVGLSTGASLALHLAAHYQLEGVAALSPALFLKNKSSVILPYLPILFPYRYIKGGPDISDVATADAVVKYRKTPLKAAKEVLKLYAHLKMDLPEIYVPVLLIQAEQDHVVDPKGAQWIYDHISSKEKKILKLSKSFHVITLDVEKKIVFREIERFISERL